MLSSKIQVFGHLCPKLVGESLALCNGLIRNEHILENMRHTNSQYFMRKPHRESSLENL